MSLTLNLPEKLERELSEKAAQLGIPLSEYVASLLTVKSESTSKDVKTGADLVAYWAQEKLIGTRPDIQDSRNYARKLRVQAEKRL